jgi:glycosyltransferase involved in cell wall biosynthesis
VKVGLLTTGFPRFEGDHCGSFLLTLAQGLVAQGHTVRVLAPEPGRHLPPPRWSGIEVRWVPYLRPRARQRTFYGAGAPDNLRAHPARSVGAATFSALLLREARRSLEDCDTLVSSWCLPCSLVASAVAGGRDHLAICHETDLRWLGKAPGAATLAHRIAAGATSFWFLSARHRDRFLSTAGLDPSRVPAHVGPMPIGPSAPPKESRAALRRALGIEGFSVLFLGRLVPVKGVDQLLRAAAASNEPVHVRIAGDGPERRKLTALARHLGVDAAFEGWVSGERKEALLVACDAVVVPSRAGDGLPTVLFEAKARAVPIVATRAGAIPDALGNHEGVRLVPPDDPRALCHAIDRVRAARAPSPLADGS